MRTTLWPLLILGSLAACDPPAPSSSLEPAVNAANSADPAAPAPAESTNSATNEAAVPTPEPAPWPKTFTARGQEPGWLLTIANGRIDYQGNYGETKINVPAPAPDITANGRRYATSQITVDVIHARCNDAMSGQGYTEGVRVTANGQSYDGCGGARREDWDQ